MNDTLFIIALCLNAFMLAFAFLYEIRDKHISRHKERELNRIETTLADFIVAIDEGEEEMLMSAYHQASNTLERFRMIRTKYHGYFGT